MFGLDDLLLSFYSYSFLPFAYLNPSFHSLIIQALEAEVSGRCTHCDVIFAKAQSLIDRGHFASKEIKAKIKQVQANWIRVKELAQNRKERLKDAAQSLQVKKEF